MRLEKNTHKQRIEVKEIETVPETSFSFPTGTEIKKDVYNNANVKQIEQEIIIDFFELERRPVNESVNVHRNDFASTS